jgi:hypothetical protein
MEKVLLTSAMAPPPRSRTARRLGAREAAGARALDAHVHDEPEDGGAASKWSPELAGGEAEQRRTEVDGASMLQSEGDGEKRSTGTVGSLGALWR